MHSQLSEAIAEVDIELINLEENEQNGAVACGVLRSEITGDVVDTMSRVSSCLGAYDYYDSRDDSGDDSGDDPGDDSDSGNDSDNESDYDSNNESGHESDSATGPTDHRRTGAVNSQRQHQKCGCAREDNTHNGYEADLEWWCMHDITRNNECFRHVNSVEPGSVRYETDEIFAVSLSQIKKLCRNTVSGGTFMFGGL